MGANPRRKGAGKTEPKASPGGRSRRAAPPDLSRSYKKLSAGRCFEELVRLQERLLAPGGCLWDREQTHESLRTYLLEETYEVLEALDAQDFEKQAEEFGDLLLQVVFHAALARREGKFEIRDVIERIHTKLVRRHPHVFGDVRAADARAVLRNWEQLKAAERGAKGNGSTAGSRQESLLDGVPTSLPALLEGYQLTRRAAKIGFDWESSEGILAKINEEIAELRQALVSRNSPAAHSRVEEEAGDLLFAVLNLARFLNVDPEVALKAANRKFARRFRSMEGAAARRGSRLADVSREEMESLWEESKKSAG